jgi:hypothetical protein
MSVITTSTIQESISSAGFQPVNFGCNGKHANRHTTEATGMELIFSFGDGDISVGMDTQIVSDTFGIKFTLSKMISRTYE